MYKVILVDDEQFITDGLVAMIDWKSYNLEVVGTASNGDELIKLFNNTPADIIITDIHMPDINGLKLIETIKANSPDVKFIVLSGFDDFAYVQEGIRLGIENYLLKPINKQELILTLKNTVEKIERTVTIENFLKNDFNILKDNILYRWVTNSIDYQELMERADLLGINLDYPYYMVSCIKLVSQHDSNETYYNKERSKTISSLYSLSSSIIKDAPDFMNFCDLNGNIVMILGSNDKYLIKENLEQMLTKIKTIAKNELSTNIFITVGDIEQTYASIHKSYGCAIEIQDYILLVPQDTIIYYNNIADINKKNMIKEELNLEGFAKVLTSDNINEIFNFIDNFFEKIREGKCVTPSDVQNYAIEMMLLIMKHYNNEQNSLLYSATSNFKSLFSSILKINSLSGLKEEIKKQINELSCDSTIGNRNLSPIIKQVLNYVNLNYSKDVCLKSLSAIFNINSAYLGQLFQKEMNESLSEYVNKLRMQKSKELLLTTKLKNADIAIAVGFYDCNYFYRKFKDHFKVSPSELRTNLNKPALSSVS
jgi:two-component system response regulator YesN